MDVDLNYVSIGLISILTVIILILLIVFAVPMKLIDQPNERSSHHKPTPRGAGIAIYTSIIFTVFAIYDMQALLEHWYFILAISLIFLLGLYDDVKDSAVDFKFYVIIVSAALLYFYDFRIQTFGTYFGIPIDLIPWISFPVTLFAVVGFTNALNLIDGLDGLSGLISLIILLALWYIGYSHNDAFIFNVTSLTIPAIIIFIVFNWNPAKIFLGDCGSLTLGFLIGILSIKALSYIDPVSILYIAALPIMDTVIVMTRRKLNGKSMFSPDKTHMHHIVIAITGWGVKATVLFLGFIQLIYSTIGLFLTTVLSQEITLSLFFLNLFIVSAILHYYLKQINLDKN